MGESAVIDLGKEFVEHKVVLLPARDIELPVNLITDNWLKSYRNSAFARPIRTDIYNAAHREVIERLWNRSGFLLAAYADEPSTIVGWLCFEGSVLHYIYVKRAFRRIGIGSKLLLALPASPKYVSHLTYAGGKFKSARLPRALYNPYAC